MATYTLIFSLFPCVPYRNKWIHHGYNLDGTADTRFYKNSNISPHYAAISHQWNKETWLEEVLKYNRPLRKIKLTINQQATKMTDKTPAEQNNFQDEIEVYQIEITRLNSLIDIAERKAERHYKTTLEYHHKMQNAVDVIIECEKYLNTDTREAGKELAAQCRDVLEFVKKPYEYE